MRFGLTVVLAVDPDWLGPRNFYRHTGSGHDGLEKTRNVMRDFVAANILLLLNGLLIAVFLGWVWQRRAALQACDLHESRLG